MFTFRKTWLHINLRLTLCFKWLAQGQPWKRVPTYGQPLCRTVVLKKNLSCTSYHCVRLFRAVKYSLPPSRTMCKYSALNSGASLNRGRKFITGIPSRHESCQKIRHIPVRVRHISTPSTCTGTPLKWVENTLCFIFWLRSASVGKMPCDFALGLVWDHSLYRSPAKTRDTVSIAR